MPAWHPVCGSPNFERLHSMRWILVVTVLANLAAHGAYAQNVNSSWVLGGGSITEPTTGSGTGFSATSGDPLYHEKRASGQFIPGYPVTNHPSISDAGALRGPVPPAPRYVPTPSGPFEYYSPASRR